MKLIHKSGSVRCNNSTISSKWDCTWPTYGENLLTIITDANKKAFLPNSENLLAHRREKVKYSYSLPVFAIIQLSSFSPTSSILCLFRATKRCRNGTDRIGGTVKRKTTVTKLMLMCIHGMLDSVY